MAAFPGSGSTWSTSCGAPSDALVTDAPTPRLVLYGRRRGRPLRPGRQGLVDGLLPSLAINLPASGELDPRSMFADPPRSVWLEIGFGGGEHLAAQAERHRDIGFIGCEVFENGIAKLVGEVERRNFANIRLFTDDARLLIGALPAASIERVFILFPDPWPKTRHHKRRLMQPDFIAALAHIVRPGGRLRFATDWRDYAASTLARVLASSDWTWPAERAADWRLPPADHLTTRYEQKALGDTPPIFLEFERG